MKHLKFYKIAALMALLVIFCSSCGEDDPVMPDYAGTWVATATVPTEAGDFEGKEILTLTEKSFSDLAQIQIGTKWIDLMLMKGSMSVSGNTMTVTLNEVGMTSFNMATGAPTGVIDTSKDGEDDFITFMEQLEMDITFTSEFSVAGNKLTIKTDYDGDGEYLGEDELTVYTKQ